jgi:hypothetical protein
MGYHIVRIRTDTWDALRDLQRVYDLDVFRQTAKQLADRLFEIQGLLSDEQIGQLSNRGYQIEIIADAAKIARERTNEVSRLHSSSRSKPD